jgi:hypothetical protein
MIEKGCFRSETAFFVLISNTKLFCLGSPYVGNSAVDFGERERTTIFLVALRRFFVGEKNWSWSFALTFWFFFVKEKERKEKIISFY